jgi:hypothetical protein
MLAYCLYRPSPAALVFLEQRNHVLERRVKRVRSVDQDGRRSPNQYHHGDLQLEVRHSIGAPLNQTSFDFELLIVGDGHYRLILNVEHFTRCDDAVSPLQIEMNSFPL